MPAKLERPLPPPPYEMLPDVPSFALNSTDFADGAPIPSQFAHPSCGGANISPALAWSGAPAGTKSYVVSCFDPDAPVVSGFWHWTAVNLPADVTELTQGAGASDKTLPGNAFHVRNDFGTRQYDGCAPPPDDRAHRYFFALHAIDVQQLDVNADTPPTAVGFQLAFHTLGRAVLFGTFTI